ncbi:formate dehydrogenase accessory sulfurtransferase FdhD [Rhizorhabdus sp.]|uniref:formate dehydrogenase accessory sulfurtransferase FdhD n=1 Tax=Rhizorhabdus sp. TaxID=1968843 RepID=UPI001B7A0877|nr:formate dehydrogenase accessory sulfurtransferase FdhD [Rhizorhabdus sp.]MBP8232008.1 formate dehydrogenase accessory sulfurtransferase FdhD [Rhizorhabdus sp.]
MTSIPPLGERAFTRITASAPGEPISRRVAEETPVAIEYDGLGYAVLMATPADLDDLVLGFSLAERLIDRPEQIAEISPHDVDRGIILRASLASECRPRVADRVRHRLSESSCGLCGIENLEQALRPLPMVEAGPPPADAALFRAVAALGDCQPLNRATGAMHAAALCGPGGDIRLVREDVGRHNALDKLIGAMARIGQGWDGGFALVTSRCSFELVEKAVLAGCPTLVAISAPTGLAIDRAKQAGLRLIVLARGDAMLLA